MADDIFHLNQNSAGPLSANTPKQTVVIPSSESDIVIRTMASDLASLTASGGTQIEGQHVQVASSDEALKSNASNTSSYAPPSRLPLILMIGLIGLAILAVIGYMVWKIWFSSATPSSNSGITSTPSEQKNTAITSPALAPAVGVYTFSHASLLKRQADATASFNVGASSNSSADLQTYSQKVSSALSGASRDASFFEISVNRSASASASFGEFMYAISTNLIDQNVLTNNFIPDFTFFVYKDSNGYWPGFVLQLQSSKNWLFLKDELSRIEKASARDSVFLTPPGTPSADGFRDDAVGDLPVRSLNYSNPSASFMYGWLRNYFIISTSRDGMREVLNRL